jgi:hypothetical protein
MERQVGSSVAKYELLMQWKKKISRGSESSATITIQRNSFFSSAARTFFSRSFLCRLARFHVILSTLKRLKRCCGLVESGKWHECVNIPVLFILVER